MNIRKERPTAVLVLAILYLLAGFGFAVGGCLGKGSTFAYALLSATNPDVFNPNVPDAAMGAQLTLLRDDESFLPIVSLFFALFLVAGIGQCAAGIGLLFMKPWARPLALWLAGLIIVTTLANTSHELAVLTPVEFGLAQRQGGMAPFHPVKMIRVTTAMRVLGSLPALVLAGASFYYLTRKSVRDAFLPLPELVEGDPSAVVDLSGRGTARSE